MMLSNKTTSLCLLALLLSASAQSQGLRATASPTLNSAAARAVQSGPQQADYIVAVVNSEPITRSDLMLRLSRVRAQMGAQAAQMPADELARQVLERLIEEKTQLQMAADEGVKVDEEAVDVAEQNVARQNQMEVAELRRRIQADGLNLGRFRAELREQITLGRVRERMVESRVRVSDADIDVYLRDKKANIDLSTLELDLAQILAEVRENASAAEVEARKERATKLLERARKGEDFAALIKEASDGSERKTGASMGLRTADRYPSLFVQVTAGLERGAVTGPVRSPAGFHILKVMDKRQPGLPPTTVTQSHARHILLRTDPKLPAADAAAKLAEFKQRIRSGKADFAQLAKEYSQDGSAKDGGDLGWANPGLFVPEFEEVMNKLAPGEISDPLPSRFGVHIIQLLERREGPLSVREQRELVRNIVREKKLDESYNNWVQDVRGRAYVEFREPPL